MNIHDMTKEELLEESLINITHQVLTERRESLTLAELMEEFRKLTGISEKELKAKLLQFYTDLNIDGRFLAIQDNRWGLREWYPVDQLVEETAPVVKVRKKKKKKKDYDEEDIEEDDDEEEIFDEEYVELGEEDDVDDEEDEEEEVVELEEDLIDPDDDLEVIPEVELDIEEDDEDEEEDEEYDEEYEEEK
ncbi:DNA-directed RNA polymerase subunit delta [Sporosarcina sp. P3]|uniref:DNA-directed RNA polymerase subunit delta n=1 Tax=Sporosarcina sp. P3 TaxID=2048245 RepID=UPI000C16D827|nr:DNA-directed RNA polymerase subunit delta [Sporosarcina sp. P3]PID21680.1 DNA-directed RNA polymerase subunit delta [Sporosarcina sp. P3]